MSTERRIRQKKEEPAAAVEAPGVDLSEGPAAAVAEETATGAPAEGVAVGEAQAPAEQVQVEAAPEAAPVGEASPGQEPAPSAAEAVAAEAVAAEAVAAEAVVQVAPGEKGAAPVAEASPGQEPAPPAAEAVAAEAVAAEAVVQVAPGEKGAAPIAEAAKMPPEESVGEEIGAMTVETIGQSLYQLGLQAGLAPEEVARQVGTMPLPGFVRAEAVLAFRKAVVVAYEQDLARQLNALKRDLGL